MDEQKLTDLVNEFENRIRYLETQRINQQQILPLAVQDRHLSGFMLHSGLDANKPTSGTTGILAWFSTDVNKLYIWNGTAYKSVTLT